MVVLHYRPTQMERAYGSHLLQNQFHHDHHITDLDGDDDDREGSVHIPGRDAVPFLTTSGLDRAALRAIWTVVDPEGIGTLTRRSQFQIVLRLVAMAQSDLLPPIPPDASANDSALMLKDSLHKYQTLKVSLPTFSTIPMPTTAYLLSTYATRKSTSTTNADDSDQAIFNMAIDHDFQYKNWLKQQELQQQQQQQQQQQSLQNGMHVLSVSDAFGDLIHVEDMPLPSYNSQQQPPSPPPPPVEMDDNVFIPHEANASMKGDVGTTDDTCDNTANSVHDGTTSLLSSDHATTDILGSSSSVQHLPNDSSPEPENECVVPNETASPENECGNREDDEDDFGDFEGVVSDEANEECKVDDISQREDVRVDNFTLQNGNHDLVVACVEKNIHEKEEDGDDHSFDDFVTADMGAQKGAFSSETAFNEDVNGKGDADDLLKAGGENDSDVNIMESSSSHPAVTEDVGQDGDGSVKDDDKTTTMKESDKSTMRNWGVESDAALGLYIPSPDKVMGTSTNTLGLESFNPSASFFASSDSVDSEGKRKTAMSMAMNDMRASKLSVFDSLVELDMQRASPAPVGGDHSKDDGLQRLETGTNSKGGSVPSDGSADERNVISDDHDDFGDFDNGGEFNKQQIETQWGDVQSEGIAKGGNAISDEQKDEFGDFDSGGGGFGEPQGKNERGSVLSEVDAKGDDVRPDEDEDEFGDFDDGGAFGTSKSEGDDLDVTFYSAQADGSSFSRATTPSLHVDAGEETRGGVGIPSSAQSAVTAPATSEPERHVQPAEKAGLANKSFDSDFGDFADASDYATSAKAETASHEKVNEGSGTYKAVEVTLGLSIDNAVAENCGVVNSATGVAQSAVEVPCRLSVFDALVEADLANAELCKKDENTTKIGNMIGSSSVESHQNPSLFDGSSKDADVLPPCDDQSGVSVQLNANVTDSSTTGVFFTTQNIALPFPDSNKVRTAEETAEYEETGDEKKSTDSAGIAETTEMNGISSTQKLHMQSSGALDGIDVRDSFSVMQQSESNANKLSVFDALVELDLAQANFTAVGGFFSDKDEDDNGQVNDAAVDSIAQADSSKPVINSRASEASSEVSAPLEESSRKEDLELNQKPNDTGGVFNCANFLAADEDEFADFGDFEGTVDSASHSLVPSGSPVPHPENVQHEVSATGSSGRPGSLSLELALNSNGVEAEYCGEIALAQTPEVRSSSPLHFPKEEHCIVEPIPEKHDHDWNSGKNNDRGGTESDTEATEIRLNGGAHMPKGDFSADHSSFEAEWGDFEGIGVEVGDPSQPEFCGSEKQRELEDDNDEFGEWGDFGAAELPQQNDPPSHLTVAGFPVGWDTNRIMSCSLSDLAELLFSVEMLEEALKVNDKGESINERTLREWREKLCQYFADEPSQRTHLKLEEMRNRVISMEKELPASLRKPLVTETNDSSVSDIVSFSSNFERFVGAGDEDNENSKFLPLGEQAKISPEKAIRRQVRAKRCLGLHRLLTTTHKQNVSHWEKIMSTAVDELAMARFLLQDMLDGTLSQEERSKIVKCNRVRVFVQGLGEYIRVVRSIVSTMGDLLCLDYNASWTEENLSSWGNFSFMQQAMEAEKLWTDIIAEVQRLHLTISWTLESVEEIRNAISLKHHRCEGDLSQGICNLTLQPLVVGDSTKSRVFWDERPYMACAANFWSNRIALEAP